MNFKEALIAHLQGENVQIKKFSAWQSFADWLCGGVSLKDALSDGFANTCQFRIAPRTIIVNGVEVPAPERDAPMVGTLVFVADPTSNCHHFSIKWAHGEQYNEYLKRNLVYLNKEDAISRAEAMLITEGA